MSNTTNAFNLLCLWNMYQVKILRNKPLDIKFKLKLPATSVTLAASAGAGEALSPGAIRQFLIPRAHQAVEASLSRLVHEFVQHAQKVSQATDI